MTVQIRNKMQNKRLEQIGESAVWQVNPVFIISIMAPTAQPNR